MFFGGSGKAFVLFSFFFKNNPNSTACWDAFCPNARPGKDMTLDRRYEFRESMRSLVAMGFKLYATPGTADYYFRLGIPVRATRTRGR